MKKIFLMAAVACMALVGCKQNSEPAQAQEPQDEGATVYMTTEVSPEALINIYEALGVKAEGRVAVKISTGEAGGNNYLHPELIGDFVKHVGGKLVECNTAYGGSRQETAKHMKTIEEHGFNTIGGVDIMDADGEMQIPVRDTTYIKYDIVGKNLANYDFMINLAHFKGHAMGGFGGVLKNASIGVASTAGKCYIHSNGEDTNPATTWSNLKEENQDKFLECMATAAAAVHDYMKGKVLYIAVMNNISIDCDCDGNPHAPELKDMGILASTDPVALDQACYDLVYNHKDSEGDNAASLRQRIDKQHGIHTVEHAEAIGLGTRKYHIVSIQK
ncbi:MAG: DUF362 domain-containing protein [Bacteroidales bacterium]|nr:DUF362 domain-containing protein [Bacteroidales bacterium]